MGMARRSPAGAIGGADPAGTRMVAIPLSLYPDYTVGPGIAPGLLTSRGDCRRTSARGLGVAAITAGEESHLALRTRSREDCGWSLSQR